MPKVVISGWKVGCNTVSAIKQIRASAPMPLNEASDVVNRVLRNERVEVLVSTAADAHALADSLERIGLLAKGIGD
jgi:hypothetical protein